MKLLLESFVTGIDHALYSPLLRDLEKHFGESLSDWDRQIYPIANYLSKQRMPGYLSTCHTADEVVGQRSEQAQQI